MLESFQVLGVSSLGVWLGDGEGEVGWRVDKLGSGDEEFSSPGAVRPRIGEDPFVGVDDVGDSLLLMAVRVNDGLELEVTDPQEYKGDVEQED